MTSGPPARRRLAGSRRARSALVIAALALVGAVWPAQTSAQEPEAVERGGEVYAANCAMCHGADATGMMSMHPALRGAVGRLSREGVEVTIRNGRETMPPMPAFGDRLTDEEIADVIAYLDGLPPRPRNFEPEARTATACPAG